GDVVGSQLAVHKGEATQPVDASAIKEKLKGLSKNEAKPQQDDGFGFFDEPAPKHGRRSTDRPEVESAPAGRRATAKQVVSPNGDSSSIRVSVSKVDQLINLVGELVITQAMLVQKAGENPELANGMADLERNTRDLQEAVLSIRMLPMAFVFNRFPRM